MWIVTQESVVAIVSPLARLPGRAAFSAEIKRLALRYTECESYLSLLHRHQRLQRTYISWIKQYIVFVGSPNQRRCDAISI
jgi:hypothetical protein